MVPQSCDFAIIGGGSAGYAAARTASNLGLHTVIIDGAHELGGLCILRGCMPSKTLIESARRALAVRTSAEFGVQATFHNTETTSVRDRKRRLIGEFADFRRQQLHSGPFDLVRGSARFLDPHSLEITLQDGTAHRLKPRTILIATGSVINQPKIDGLDSTGFWTSDTALDAADIPASLIVLGGGAIALELAHFFEGIGRQVSVIQRNENLLSEMDPDLSQVVEIAFRERGMRIHTGTRIQRIERAGPLKRVVFEKAGAETVEEAAEIFVALGRRPAIASLDTAAAGIEIAMGHVATRHTQQTSQPHIYAAGDVCGPLEVVHLAVQQGEIAARNAAAWIRGEELPARIDYRLRLFGVFTDPQVAAVGLNAREATALDVPVLTATYPFNDHGKSMIMNENHGFVKLIADARSGEILGGAVVGPEATELIHEIAVAMHFRATAADLAAVPHYHPTLSEIWTYPAEEIADKVPGPAANPARPSTSSVTRS